MTQQEKYDMVLLTDREKEIIGILMNELRCGRLYPRTTNREVFELVKHKYYELVTSDQNKVALMDNPEDYTKHGGCWSCQTCCFWDGNDCTCKNDSMIDICFEEDIVYHKKN